MEYNALFWEYLDKLFNENEIKYVSEKLALEGNCVLEDVFLQKIKT